MKKNKNNKKYQMNNKYNNKNNKFSGLKEDDKFYFLVDEIARITNFQPRICGNGFYARCPVHGDRQPSLKISQGRDGRILMYCFAGCTIDQLCHALNIEKKDLFASDNEVHHG